MGAPIIIDGSFNLWVSNGSKDLFCEIVVDVAKLEGIDVSEVYEIAPGVAGTYRVSGLGIDLREFYPYFGGREGFRKHPDVCQSRLKDLKQLDERVQKNMTHLIAWAKFKMDGGRIEENQNFYEQLPLAQSFTIR